MAFDTYNEADKCNELKCHNAIASNLKDFTIKYLNEDGESFGFDAMLYAPNGIEIPLEYECSLHWYGDTYPSHWKYTKWFKNKADTKYRRFIQGNWKTGFYLKFNRNCTVFYIASFNKIVQMQIETSKSYRNGNYFDVDSYYIMKEDMYLFRVEDINEVFKNMCNSEALEKLRIK